MNQISYFISSKNGEGARGRQKGKMKGVGGWKKWGQEGGGGGRREKGRREK
jgi:hypothetical protein